jgi:hypothetical protein
MHLAVHLARATGTDTAQEFPAWIGHAADLAQLLGLVLAVLAGWWAYLQLKSATASAETQAVIALDQAFSLFEQFRTRLNNNEKFRKDLNADDADKVALRRYIAVFERLGLLLKKKVIKVELADQLYGSRLQKLFEHAETPVKTILEQRERKGWDNFWWLWRKMRDEKYRTLPDPDKLP